MRFATYKSKIHDNNTMKPMRGKIEVHYYKGFLKKFIYFIYLFLAALGLCCCVWAFSSCGKWGPLFSAVRGLLIAVASHVAEHGL